MNWLWEEGLKLDVLSYSIVINEIVKVGDLDDVLKLFDEMCERGVVVDVICYNILIDGFFKGRD